MAVRTRLVTAYEVGQARERLTKNGTVLVTARVQQKAFIYKFKQIKTVIKIYSNAESSEYTDDAILYD